MCFPQIIIKIGLQNCLCNRSDNLKCSVRIISSSPLYNVSEKKKENETNHKVKWILCLTFFLLFIVNVVIFLSSLLDVQNVFYYVGNKFTCNLHSNRHQKQHPPRLCHLQYFFVSALTECVDNTSLNAFDFISV